MHILFLHSTSNSGGGASFQQAVALTLIFVFVLQFRSLFLSIVVSRSKMFVYPYFYTIGAFNSTRIGNKFSSACFVVLKTLGGADIINSLGGADIINFGYADIRVQQDK